LFLILVFVSCAKLKKKKKKKKNKKEKKKRGKKAVTEATDTIIHCAYQS
jgi:uncharacterized membrane protein